MPGLRPHLTLAPRVLVVDDDPETRAVLASLLEQAGLTVTVAADGRSALLAAAKTPLDVILLDAHLPDMDGWQVCERMRKSDPPLAARIVMLTAFGSDEVRDRAVRAGADDYITKPCRAEQLVELVRRLADA